MAKLKQPHTYHFGVNTLSRCNYIMNYHYCPICVDMNQTAAWK